MPSRPNVLLLIDGFDVGGAEGQLILLARKLLAGGRYAVHFGCLHRSGALLAEAETLSAGLIPEFPLTSFYDFNMLVQLRRFGRFVRERKIDIVHTDGFYTNVFGITGAALARVPARVAFRGETEGWRASRQNFVERRTFRFASVIHANSEAVKSYLVREGVPSQRIVVIYNGLDMERVTVSPSLSRRETLATFGLPADADRRFVTIVANMRHHVKDHPMFLRSAGRIRAVVPEAVFVLAGEGELTSSLRALAAEFGLAQDTFFIGRCDRIAELLAVSDVCVLSSKAEGFSNSILEYMGAGRPVVATDVGGAREAIVNGGTGYLVASGDDKTMAECIVTLLQNPAQAREMGARGRRIAQEKFSDQVQLERTQALYDRLVAKRASGSPRRDVAAALGD
jgi:glycosyltransferase involved in cell wall biosynthesis